MAIDVTREYVSHGGLTIHLRPIPGRLINLAISRLEEELRSEGLPLDPPTYEIPAFGSSTVSVPLAEDLLEVEDDPEETERRKTVWKAHQEALAKLSKESSKATQSALLGLGARFNMPADEEWLTEVEWVTNGAPVPENPIDRRVFFLLHYALTDMEVQIVVGQLQMMSVGMMASESDVASFRGGFQGKMARGLRAAIAAFNEGDEEEQMDSEPDAPGSTSDDGLEVDAEAMGLDE